MISDEDEVEVEVEVEVEEGSSLTGVAVVAESFGTG
jgi:hypothetical protein